MRFSSATFSPDRNQLADRHAQTGQAACVITPDWGPSVGIIIPADLGGNSF